MGGSVVDEHFDDDEMGGSVVDEHFDDDEMVFLTRRPAADVEHNRYVVSALPHVARVAAVPATVVPLDFTRKQVAWTE